jgi:hypothetical protein
VVAEIKTEVDEIITETEDVKEAVKEAIKDKVRKTDPTRERAGSASYALITRYLAIDLEAGN